MTLLNFIKKPISIAYRQAIRLSLALYGRKYQYVFVLAHMRSGSTLLSHILASHPEFSGAGETHVTYRTPADLSNLAVVTCQWLHKLQLSTTYVVDQINHNRLLDATVLSSPLIHKCVILIRSPEATLQSMISLFGWQEKIALDYYVARLDALGNYGQILKERALLIEYDDLVEHTEETLATLTKFFDVSQPFNPFYETRRTTGLSGDPNSNIRTGRVFRTQSHNSNIDAAVLTHASTAFLQCRDRLLNAGVRLAIQARPQLPPRLTNAGSNVAS